MESLDGLAEHRRRLRKAVVVQIGAGKNVKVVLSSLARPVDSDCGQSQHLMSRMVLLRKR